MESMPFAFTIVVVVLLLSFAGKSNTGEVKQSFKSFGNSNYSFHNSSRNWGKSNEHCMQTGSKLVSIESEQEWEFLNSTIQNMTTAEYFIGLTKDSQSNEWRWISSSSKVYATKGQRKFHWARGEPSGDGNCAVMYKNYNQNFGKYNDLRCSNQKGYICESSADSSDQQVTTVGQTSSEVTSATRLKISYSPSTEAPSEEATQQTESGTKESATKPIMTQSTSFKYSSTKSNTQATSPTNVKDVPIKDTAKSNTKVIIIVLALLTFLILIVLIALYVMYARRRNFKKQALPLPWSCLRRPSPLHNK